MQQQVLAAALAASLQTPLPYVHIALFQLIQMPGEDL